MLGKKKEANKYPLTEFFNSYTMSRNMMPGY